MGLRAGCLLLLAWAGGVALWAAPASESDRPIALPPFVVDEATKGPPWRFVEARGYEVLSRCRVDTTRRVVAAHQRLHELLESILPPALQVRHSVPPALILYDEELQPTASREVIARLLQTPAAPPRPSARSGPPAFSFLPNLRLWDRDAMTVFMIVRQEDGDLDHLSLTPDYVSYLLTHRVPALPPWFVTGFLSLFRATRFAADELRSEPLVWLTPAATDALLRAPRSAPPLQPLARFFAVDLDRAEGDPAYDPRRRWLAQAELLVRWGLAEPSRRAGFWRLIEQAAAQGVTESLFQACLGLTFAEAEQQLAAWLPQAVQRELSFRAPPRKRPTPLLLRNATDAEVGRIRGEWERLQIAYVKAIAPALAPKYLEQARRTLARALDRVGAEPGLLAVLGLCEVDYGSPEQAREYLESAARNGMVRPRAWLELARLRLAAFTGAAAPPAPLTVAETADVLAPLFRAREQAPPLPEVYEVIGEVWARSAARPTRGHLAALDEGVRLFPHRSALVLRSAELYQKNGFATEAAALVELGRRVAPDAASRARFDALMPAAAP